MTDAACGRPTGPVEAVTFDFWNTLVHDTGGIRNIRLDAAAERLTAAGQEVDRADLEAAFGRSWDLYVEHWKANRPFGAADASATMVEQLGLTDGCIEPLTSAFTDPPPDWRPPLTENVAACLSELREAGVVIGIICDVGMTPGRVLRRYLDDHGVLELFDHWSFSDEVGVFKPDARIFDHALDGLSTAAGRSLDAARLAHVGDLRRTDIAGALAFGATAVRYSGVFADPGDAERGTDTVEGHLVVSDHAYLPAALGVTEPQPLPD